MARSSTEIVESLIEEGKIQRPDWSWAPKSPEADIVVATGSEFARENIITDYIRYLTRLDGYAELATNTTLRSALMEVWSLTEDELDAFLEDDLDNFADTWGLITRNGGSYAKGPVTLVFSNNNPVLIVEGTKFISVLRRKEYLTVEEISSVTPTLTDGRYIIRCFVQCSVIGNDGNITANSVMQPETKINNFIRAEVSVDVDNGEGKENNVDFVERIKQSRLSRGAGSRSFLRTLLLDDDRVYDIYLNARGDTGFNRPQGIDAWVYAQETPKAISEKTKRGHGYTLETQPLIDDSPIITSGYTLTRDKQEYRGSVEALDNVHGADNSTIEYYIDDTIRSLQLKVEDQDNWILGGRRIVLVKKAQKVKIDISFRLYITFGSVLSTVKSAINNNLLYFFSGGTTNYGEKFTRKLIDADIDKSDILNIVTNTEGVDRINLVTFSVVRNDGLYPNRDPLPTFYYEFPSLGQVSYL